MSKRSRSGWCSSALNIVGTPPNVVARSRSMTSRTLPGSKRGTSVSSPPACTVTFMIELMPKTWNSGSVATVTVSGPASTWSQPTRAAAARLACVSVAPFGVPVVPDV